MTGSINLAWAIPVNTQKLGAQLEAYVESKPFVDAFNLAIRYGLVSRAPIGRLPPELVTMIIGLIREPMLARCEVRWAKYQRCCDNDCTTLDHFTEDEIRDNPFDPDYEPLDKDDLEIGTAIHFQTLQQNWDYGHETKVKEFIERFNTGKAAMSKSDAMFANCRNVSAPVWANRIALVILSV